MKITLERITGNITVNKEDCKEIEIDNKPSILIYENDVYRKLNETYYIAFEKRTVDAIVNHRRKTNYQL